MTHEEQVNHVHTLFQNLIQVILGRLAMLFNDQNLTLPQVRLLYGLAILGPSSVKQIAGYLGIGHSATSLLVDKLVKIQIVERTEDQLDRRRAVVQLSSKGSMLLEGKQAGQFSLHTYFRDLSEDQLATLDEVFTAMLTSYEEIKQRG